MEMKKLLLAGAAALLFSTAAYAHGDHDDGPDISGTLNDLDGSNTHVTYTGDVPDNDFDEAATSVDARFTLRGTVSKVCALGGVDLEGGGLANDGLINMGTIGIEAGDDTAVSSQFEMTGPIEIDINSPTGGCNYNNRVTVTKNHVDGLRNLNPGNYDSAQFRTNIPYSAAFKFIGVETGQGTGSATHVTASTSQVSATKTFGAWRSAWELDIDAPRVTDKGLVGGTYEGVVTVLVEII